VAALCIATTARNPVSGMTMLTIIVSSVVLLQFGLSGTTGMFFVMMIAGMVCTALSVSGQTITDLKTGYWLGSTPSKQERMKFIGVAASAVAAALTIAVLAKVFYFGEAPEGGAPRTILEAPQAAIMKALVQSFMDREPVAVILFGAGAMITIMMEMLGVPALIFALGMYLPLYLNAPALVGGILVHFLDRRALRIGGDRGRTVRERGIVIASGLMAGGALGGVIGAAMRLVPGYREDWIPNPLYSHDAAAQIVSITGFALFVVYTWWAAQRVPKN
jgi:putative OPT family oligopeptide transporter